MSELERRTDVWTPGRYTRIVHYVIGDLGVVQFMWSPGLGQSEYPWDDVPLPENRGRLMGWDLGWHAPKPPADEWPDIVLYNDDEPEGGGHYDSWPFWGTQNGVCEFFDDGCLYDGSSLAATDMLNVLINGGDGAEEEMWNRLEIYYKDVFVNRDDDER